MLREAVPSAASATSAARPFPTGLPTASASGAATTSPPVLTRVALPVPSTRMRLTSSCRLDSAMSTPATPTGLPPRSTGTATDVMRTVLPPTSYS